MPLPQGFIWVNIVIRHNTTFSSSPDQIEKISIITTGRFSLAQWCHGKITKAVSNVLTADKILTGE